MHQKLNLNKQTKNRLMDTNNILTGARWERGEWLEEKGGGIEKHRWAGTESTQGCKAHPREESQ